MSKSTYNAIDRSFQFVCGRNVFYQISLALLPITHENQLAEFYNSRATHLPVSSIAINKMIESVFDVFWLIPRDISNNTSLSVLNRECVFEVSFSKRHIST